jgi:hypothetical protein
MHEPEDTDGSGLPPQEGEATDDIHRNLIRTRIAPDLLERMRDQQDQGSYPVIIEFNEFFPGGAEQARELFFVMVEMLRRERTDQELLKHQEIVGQFLINSAGYRWNPEVSDLPAMRDLIILPGKSRLTSVFAFGRLSASAINQVLRWRLEAREGQRAERKTSSINLIYRIWLDHELQRFVYESVRTIKADAAMAAFSCQGHDIIWAVADTGIDGSHPHFATHQTLDLPAGLFHRDFTREAERVAADSENEISSSAEALKDGAGHGTHVAGIIAGEARLHEIGPKGVDEIVVEREVRLSQSDVTPDTSVSQKRVSGVAPACKLMSLKVLNEASKGNASDLIAAIGYLQKINDHGRRIKVNGLNLSVGYPFDAKWFAAGQSPLCVEVNRLVKSGVVVVVAAGNAGYGRVTTLAARIEAAAFMCTIADPGNADGAITVGSTHRDMPHTYGVSYFSAKGPTADGRMKPDLVAPGERIVSCAANRSDAARAVYREDSGTSMAAPHVSGAIAAFLSVRREFIGQPELVKKHFVAAATDLGRRPEFQGGGALDLMRTLQSV